MNAARLLQKYFVAGWIVLFLARHAAAQPEIFRLIQTVQVTPDNRVLDGGFIRLGYVPALDRIVAVFKTFHPVKSEAGSEDGAHLYKIYTTDMQPDGETHVLNHGPGGSDSSDLFVDHILYDVYFMTDPFFGWHITKYDAVTWKKLAEIDFHMIDPRAVFLDMMIMMVNGMLDVSSQYLPSDQDPSGASATHHNFFTPDLLFLGTRILADTANIEGSSMIFVDEKYCFITANEIHGDVIVMTYDKDWNYLGMKVLLENGIWSEGVAFDGKRLYVAYMNTSLNIGMDWVPLYTNIHLAAFDRDWNLVEDLAVTNFTKADDVEAWRPYVILHGNRLYVSYDVTPHDPITHKDVMSESQAYVNVYELMPSFVNERLESPPTHYQLEQNYPNPFNPVTRIGFSLPKGEVVMLKLYDLLGREVGTLFNGLKESGRYTMTFNLEDLQSGVYFYTLQAGGFVGTRKLCLLR